MRLTSQYSSCYYRRAKNFLEIRCGEVRHAPGNRLIYVAAAPEVLAHRRGHPTGAQLLRLAVGGLIRPSVGRIPPYWAAAIGHANQLPTSHGS